MSLFMEVVAKIYVFVKYVYRVLVFQSQVWQSFHAVQYV